jgi:hypothetical protein
MATVLLKVGLALVSGILGAWALHTRLMDLPERSFRLGTLALQVVPALILFVALYVVGHQEPTSDVPSYYVPAARAVLAGQVPFRDFALSYAPGFPYVGAALAGLWNSGKAFALLAIVLNGAALLWWHSAAAAHFDRSIVRNCTVLYASSGHVLVQALLGTNQAWVSAGLAASAMLMARKKETGAGFAQATAACTTKVLAHLFWPVQWICAERRTRWLLAAIVPTALLYAAFVALGAGPGLLYPLKHEGALISPGNLPYLLDLVLGGLGPLERVVYDSLCVAALGMATLWIYSKSRVLPAQQRQSLLLMGLALTGLVFMIFSKKSFTGYLIFVMYPVTLALVAGTSEVRTRVGFLLAFNALLVAEPTLWFRLNGEYWPLRTWLLMRDARAVAGFVLLDLVLLACYVYLAWLSARGLARAAEGAISFRNPSQSATACSLV